jgi:hypothetical protein
VKIRAKAIVCSWPFHRPLTAITGFTRLVHEIGNNSSVSMRRASA